ncbi:hypothetical protein [Dinghuibacter silviterrae]|uniref:hypothetical protein n=1 Tax=Dinghuibacter silviterrae TaxID=1539049 RepID=UPI0013C378FD|nr:hypothetical protein [Dinghuibacter silviterrae]
MAVNFSPIYLRFGGADKSFAEMNQQEIKKAAESIIRRAKEKAFFKGRPIKKIKRGA